MIKEDIIFKNYHNIDLTSGDIGFVDSDSHDILDKYITTTINFVMNESTKCQLYKLKRPTNEIFAIIQLILTSSDVEERNDQCADIATMLLESELSVIRGPIRPVEGALVQTIIRKDKGFYYALIKNEFFNAIDRIAMEEIEAFLYDERKKSPLKICIFEIDVNETDEGEVKYTTNNIFVDDSIQADHGPTWYDKFLQLEKYNSDELNTSYALESILRFWDTKVPKQHNSSLLRNDTISYFRVNDKFDFEEFTEYINGRQNLEEEDSETFKKLLDLPTAKRKGFDPRFDIDQQSIKKRVVTKKFSLSKNIELSIEGRIDFNDVHIIKEDDNTHFIKIRTSDKNTIKYLTARD